MYCIYYNNIKIAEGNSKEWVIDVIHDFKPPVGVVIKVVYEEILFEFEVMEG